MLELPQRTHFSVCFYASCMHITYIVTNALALDKYGKTSSCAIKENRP